ncbi:MAG TPA: hypothetical protein P5169_09370, partial [Kiritimatiellia bacterium]|nr:hypothetical protein [Kiritimatiellia bacterium]
SPPARRPPMQSDLLAPTFPDEWSCTAWEDCQHDGICHDPKNCGAIGPNHHAFYGLSDDEETPDAE